MPEVTRPIFWNIGLPTKVAMYVLATLAAVAFVYGIARRWRVWRRGVAVKRGTLLPNGGDGRPQGTLPVPEAYSAPTLAGAASRLIRHVAIQQRIARIPLAWLSHLAIFYGFIVLFIGTVIVGLEHYGVFRLLGISWTGRFYTTSSFLLDLFGLAFVVAIPIAMARRSGLTRLRPSAGPIDAAILWLLLSIGVTGFLVEAFRIAYNFPPFEQHVSFVAWILARGLAPMGLAGEAVRPWHLASWWVHMVLVFVFLGLAPYTKMLHFVLAPVNIAISPEPCTGRLRPVSMAEVEATGRMGVETIDDFSRRQLISFDSCTQCRRCEAACPAWNTGKPLSPMRVVLDIAGNGRRQGTLHGDVILAETLWACTTCGACVHNCPVLIDQMGAIIDMRRHLVGEGQVVGSSQAALRTIASRGNPWGLPPEERDRWAEGLDVSRADGRRGVDVLLWVGCAGSYDRRNQQVTRALVKILRAAGVNFAILGNRETCTGDPARRLGDDFTFQAQAEQNVATLSGLEFKRIVTQCAHCYNTLKNEYPDFGGQYQVVHHTAFIDELIASGRLALSAAAEDRSGQSIGVPSSSRARAKQHIEAAAHDGPIAFHDPCYLSRHNDGSDAPRSIMADGLALPIVEPEAHGRRTFCCGAGGGRMWMEEAIDQRVNVARFQQLKATGATTVAVGCPFCMTMLDDAAKGEDSAIVVQDIAELVASRLR
jgi:Fe-S oxidoreductase/nitrate reductase gamma subunit